MKIRIHHFFDIIRDFGIGKKISPHPYLHVYHKVAQYILENPDAGFEIVVESDAICDGCIHLVNSMCDDLITHRTDFISKEDFNNYIDKRIIKVCNIETGIVYTPRLLCEFANKYIENIELIYQGNDLEHTLLRKENVLKGLHYYSEKHGLGIKCRT
ncbi:MAG: hypothetical protein A2W90_19390 [Bacteroidetes bacterium GWF2_42_66]|nr:MAG: hypothetical protein A2W92_18090 [Bacteroidetes bacterium GWA2_42_15]OFX98672.1 MAG: hypothetical protein A2W89_10305 [Bacteroidetes bacterium GWE2_42_39]OFY43130.1 MAG: hypothetical protein A2W90_19390 [Bacteroidetes bacterium GWF2_42_66]HBL77020.1 hypothetical protein [Prolixibacteraceae bacterium]HCR90111.1 hypothetical protein [Prolixibacteraceae bacterium]